MKIGPKYKICKRLGSSVFEKCQTQKFQLAEARSPRRVSRGRSGGGDFGIQLIEKQKARLTYGLSESQFSRYAHEAMEHKGSAAEGLLARLESRLDNVVYRAGFAPTRRAARQLVSHGHIVVGKDASSTKRMTIPSYRVSAGETVAVRQESRVSPFFGNRVEKAAETKTPDWMELADGGFAATIKALPHAGATDVAFDPSVIIQFYSR
jgi:small subunit ribosomal protein S4